MRLWKRLDHDAAGIVFIECGLSQQEAILLVDGHALRIARVVDHEPARAEAERRLPEDHVAETVNVVHSPPCRRNSRRTGLVQGVHRVLCSVK